MFPLLFLILTILSPVRGTDLSSIEKSVMLIEGFYPCIAVAVSTLDPELAHLQKRVFVTWWAHDSDPLILQHKTLQTLILPNVGCCICIQAAESALDSDQNSIRNTIAVFCLPEPIEAVQPIPIGVFQRSDPNLKRFCGVWKEGSFQFSYEDAPVLWSSEHIIETGNSTSLSRFSGLLNVHTGALVGLDCGLARDNKTKETVQFNTDYFTNLMRKFCTYPNYCTWPQELQKQKFCECQERHQKSIEVVHYMVENLHQCSDGKWKVTGHNSAVCVDASLINPSLRGSVFLTAADSTPQNITGNSHYQYHQHPLRCKTQTESDPKDPDNFKWIEKNTHDLAIFYDPDHIFPKITMRLDEPEGWREKSVLLSVIGNSDNRRHFTGDSRWKTNPKVQLMASAFEGFVQGVSESGIITVGWYHSHKTQFAEYYGGFNDADCGGAIVEDGVLIGIVSRRGSSYFGTQEQSFLCLGTYLSSEKDWITETIKSLVDRPEGTSPSSIPVIL